MGTKNLMEIFDKSKWGDGPWMSEPDYEKWTDEATGLECLIKRCMSGALCGYVKIPGSHSMHGVDYMDFPFNEILVHGGLTYFGDRENDGQHWVGFDCAHYLDICPSLYNVFGEGSYKDIEFVRSQCRILAKQINALG